MDDGHPLTASGTDGLRLYVNGEQKPFGSVNGEQNGSKVSSASRFRYGEVVEFVRQCSNLYLGYGSCWESADATYDNLRVYNRVLSEKDIVSLYAIETLSLIHISEPTRQDRPSRMPSSA